MDVTVTQIFSETALTIWMNMVKLTSHMAAIQIEQGQGQSQNFTVIFKFQNFQQDLLYAYSSSCFTNKKILLVSLDYIEYRLKYGINTDGATITTSSA